jgi:hypothetical protein
MSEGRVGDGVAPGRATRSDYSYAVAGCPWVWHRLSDQVRVGSIVYSPELVRESLVGRTRECAADNAASRYWGGMTGDVVSLVHPNVASLF